MTDFDEFLQLIWSEPGGQTYLCNFLDCNHMGLIKKETSKAFMDAWCSGCALLENEESPLRLLGEIVAQTSGEQYRFLLQAETGPSLGLVHLATIVDIKRLKGNLAPNSKRRLEKIFRLVSKFDPRMGVRDLEKLERELFELVGNVFSSADPNGIIEVDFDKPIGGAKPLMWFTSFGSGDLEDAIWQERPKWDLRADIARDKLGLIHLGSERGSSGSFAPTLLAALLVAPESIPTGLKSARPTAWDAGTHSRFRAAYGDLRKKANEWGRAADLEKVLFGRPYRGGREMVSANFVPMGPIGMSVLGFTRVPRKDFSSVHDKIFSRNIQRSRDKTAIMKQLVALCQ